MNYSKTIRLFDPFYGWGYHFDYYKKLKNPSGTRNDTGLCNRLFHWELYYDIVEKTTDPDLTIAVQSMIWPELAILNIPNTISVDYKIWHNHWYGMHEHSELYFRTIFDIENQKVSLTNPITKEKILSMYKNNNFNFIEEADHWHTEMGYYTLKNVFTELYKDKAQDYLNNYTRGIRGISFKDTEFQLKLERKYANYIGIHIRRGNGVYSTTEDVQSLNPSLIDKYNDYKNKYIKEECEIYPFQADDIYFKFMDFCLVINPKQKFYISHDLPDDFIEPYYARYGNQIVTKKDYREKYENYFSNKIKNLDHLIKYANIVENTCDLFSLASCKFLVKSPSSSWSSFAQEYQNIEYINSNEIANKLLYNRQDFYNYLEEIITRPIPNII
jgi:hypothetical protein